MCYVTCSGLMLLCVLFDNLFGLGLVLLVCFWFDLFCLYFDLWFVWVCGWFCFLGCFGFSVLLLPVCDCVALLSVF